MAKKQTRHATTLSNAVWEVAKTHCQTTGEPLARLVERAVRRELGMPRNEQDPGWVEPPDDRGIVPGPPYQVEVSAETAERLRDAVRRKSIAAGRFLDDGQVLSRAIELALDTLGAPPAPSTTR